MTEDLQREALRIFEEATARTGAGRESFIEQACAGNAELSREVHALLATSDESTDGFLAAPPWQATRLTVGSRVGPYEVTALAGIGGMGEVYRARDTRLGRDVAIKVLPEAVTAQPERLTSFEREARAVAALSHPNICALHDVGSDLTLDGSAAGGFNYLVMEYLSGQTLEARLARPQHGPAAPPLRLSEALDLAAQVADALAAAHRAGVVHRDLKPANVMLTKTAGAALSVKLLDFGLARLVRPDGSNATDSRSNASGLVVGTAPYMAPEQIEGRAVDARADIFALGAMLYEMLSGVRAFSGGSSAAVMAAVLGHDPPDVSTLAPSVPHRVSRIVRRCLAKDPDARWQCAGDLAAELRSALDSPVQTASAPVPSSMLRRALTTAAFLAAGFAVGAGITWLRLAPRLPATPLRSVLTLEPAEELIDVGGVRGMTDSAAGSRTALVWTPDGRALVFVGRRDGKLQLYLRRLADPHATPIAGTEGGLVPAVSPDGRAVAFYAAGEIRSVPVDGGAVSTLASVSGPPEGMDWGSGGRLVYALNRAIWEIEPGREQRELLPLPANATRCVLPHLLPDGTLLVTLRRNTFVWGREQVVAFRPGSKEFTVLLSDAADARFVPPAHLVFLRRGQLLVVPFDPSALTTGREVTIANGVAQAMIAGLPTAATGAGQFAVSSAGMLAWVGAGSDLLPKRTLIQVDRRGRVTPMAFTLGAGAYLGRVIDVSPDGRQLALIVKTLRDHRLFIHDLAKPGSLWPINAAGELDWPRWSPGGERIAAYSPEDGQALGWIAPYTGSRFEPLVRGGYHQPSSWSPDGRFLAVLSERDTSRGVSLVDFHAQTRGLRPFTELPSLEQHPDFSPDGRWIAYTSNVSGRQEVWVRPFPGPGPARMVSMGGGSNEVWNPRKGEHELLYVSPSDQRGTYRMMSVRWDGDGRFDVPRALFELDDRSGFECAPVRCYAISRDGQRFYSVMTAPAVAPVTRIELIQNWMEQLEVRAPVK